MHRMFAAHSGRPLASKPSHSCSASPRHPLPACLTACPPAAPRFNDRRYMQMGTQISMGRARWTSDSASIFSGAVGGGAVVDVGVRASSGGELKCPGCTRCTPPTLPSLPPRPPARPPARLPPCSGRRQAPSQHAAPCSHLLRVDPGDEDPASRHGDPHTGGLQVRGGGGGTRGVEGRQRRRISHHVARLHAADSLHFPCTNCA